jgi:hypothetical protein
MARTARAGLRRRHDRGVAMAEVPIVLRHVHRRIHGCAGPSRTYLDELLTRRLRTHLTTITTQARPCPEVVYVVSGQRACRAWIVPGRTAPPNAAGHCSPSRISDALSGSCSAAAGVERKDRSAGAVGFAWRDRGVAAGLAPEHPPTPCVETGSKTAGWRHIPWPGDRLLPYVTVHDPSYPRLC